MARRVALGIGIALVALVVAVLVATAFLVGTEAGGRWAVGQVGRLPVTVEIDGYSGRLGGRFELRGVHVEAESLVADVDLLRVEWRLLDLLGRRVTVDSVIVRGVDVAVGQAPPGEEPPPRAAADTTTGPIELPVAIALGALVVEDLDLVAPGGVRVTGGHVTASGTPDDYSIATGATVTTPALAALDLALAARGDLEHAELDALEARLLDGTVTVRGDVAWQPRVTWRITATVDSLRPQGLMPDPAAWPGALSLSATTRGELIDGMPVAEVAIDSIRGTLREHPVAGHLRARVSAPAGRATPNGIPRLDLDSIDLSWGAAGLEASGHLTDDVDLSFRIATTDLGIALPAAGGAITIEGAARGPRLAPRVTAVLHADSLRYEAQRVALLRADIDADLGGDGAYDVTLASRGIEAGGQTVDSLSVELDGNVAAHRLAVDLAGEPLTAALRVAGGLADSVWSGTIESIDLSSPLAGDWSLAAPAGVVASAAHASLDSLCLVASGGDGGRLCAAGSWRAAGASGRGASGASGGAASGPGTVDADLRIEALPLALAAPFLPEGLSLDGTAALTLDAGVAPDGALDVRLDVGIGPGRLTATLADTTQALDFAWSLAATAGADGVEVTLGADLDHVTGTRFGTVAAELALPEFTSLADTATVRTQPLTATASIQVVDLSPVAVLVPDLGRLAGRLQIDAEAAGTVGEPTVDATVALVDGAVDVPDAGLEVRDIQLAVQGNERGVVELTGSARSGGGALELSSSSSFGALEQRRATVQIRGNRFEVMNTREIRALVSPDLEVEINGDRVEVGGSITIPLTTVHLKEVPPGAAPRSGDVILVDAESDETPPPVDVFADLRVALGDSVSFQGFGLTAHMVGQLRVFQEPGKAPTATGEIEVRNGSYKAYGQDLTIGRQEDSGTNRDEAARIIFAGGPVDNPGLDLRAYRVADDGVVAGLAIGGTAKQPEITLFSEPAMPQGDALAYLMLGHPLGEGGGGDEDLLTGAATSLGLKGGNLLARSLGSKVGLDEAGIESEGSYKEAAFVAGKYLTPSLYVSQSIGLFDRVSVFRLRYLLSSNWTVEAETGQGTGTDVLYRIERGE